MIVTGMVAGLITLDFKNQNLTEQNRNYVKDLEKINKTLKAFKNHADIDLIEVTRQGNVESVKLFLDIGANPNVMDEKQETPLFYAAHFGYTEIADLLIQNGANLNLKNRNNETALFFATSSEKLKMVEMLLQHGAHVDAKNRFGDVPLHIVAKYQSNPEIAELLIKNGANVNAKDEDQLTPLYLATENGNTY